MQVAYRLLRVRSISFLHEAAIPMVADTGAAGATRKRAGRLSAISARLPSFALFFHVLDQRRRSGPQQFTAGALARLAENAVLALATPRHIRPSTSDAGTRAKGKGRPDVSFRGGPNACGSRLCLN